MLKTPTPNAVLYMLGRSKALRECLPQSASRIDNNLAERAPQLGDGAASPLAAAQTWASGLAEAAACGDATSRPDDLLCLETPEANVVDMR